MKLNCNRKKNKLKLKGYNVLFQLIEDAQNEFKKDFFKIRDDFEHNALKIQDFVITENYGIVNIIDPLLEGKNIFNLIDTFYFKTFKLIESLAAYFFGLNACHNSKGLITLFLNNGEVNPAKFGYKYDITMNSNDPALTKLIGI